MNKYANAVAGKHADKMQDTVVRNIRAMMGARSINQTQLSISSGVSTIQISNILNFKNTPRFKTLAKFAVVLEVNANDFFKDELTIKGA